MENNILWGRSWNWHLQIIAGNGQLDDKISYVLGSSYGHDLPVKEEKLAILKIITCTMDCARNGNSIFLAHEKLSSIILWYKTE